jgi:hypothetical protein
MRIPGIVAPGIASQGKPVLVRTAAETCKFVVAIDYIRYGYIMAA